MMLLEMFLPPFNTALILVSGLTLLAGFYAIRRKNVTLHRRSMLVATVFAGLFLVVYVIRWALLGSKPFSGEGFWVPLYHVLLGTHVIMAIAIMPMVVVTLRRGLQGEVAAHKRVARLTFPSWLYVVVTGWFVYWMLYSL